MVVGMFLLSMLNENTSNIEAAAYMLLLGLGIGMLMQVPVLAVQNAVKHKDLGIATGGCQPLPLARVGLRRRHLRLDTEQPADVRAEAHGAGECAGADQPELTHREPGAAQGASRRHSRRRRARLLAFPRLGVPLGGAVGVRRVRRIVVASRDTAARLRARWDGGSAVVAGRGSRRVTLIRPCGRGAATPATSEDTSCNRREASCSPAARWTG